MNGRNQVRKMHDQKVLNKILICLIVKKKIELPANARQTFNNFQIFLTFS